MSADADAIVGLYERHADAWVGARLREGRRLYERGWLESFCSLVAVGRSVLDMGCGAGAPIANYLVERGYRVMGVDSSPAMIAMFQARLPGQEAMVADMRRLSLERDFHGLLAWDSFFHLSPDNQTRMFPIFRAHAAPRAALMFTSGPARGEIIGRLEGEPLYHASLDPAEYRHLLDSQGFDVVANVAEDQSCGGRTVWLAQLR
ncbi:Methyltransferase type 12 [Methylocella silvestris BL2]|uniref:Methyltransferase type 12 n=1 Tax=Methylocella silvestris (strain DSM 15510 / CIP 108128 / LMG 27833 / NCIMB 13906 / BL2) TaxID=395965 RepID=B8EMS6_METSB|nr:class I SAM-dependent methyltransferase [Methylocella silvestris]ACK52755.1 Methyltransferase type 12 [Methylocella silvestris BL2]